MATFKKVVRNLLSPQHDKEDENYRRFSILSLLLTLVTTINNGHPTLNGSGVVRQRLDRSKDSNSQLIMESILAVLVKNTEVMACMTYQRRGKVGLGVRTQAIVTVQDEELEARTDNSKHGLSVATMANGDLEGAEQPEHYALVEDGTSLLDWGSCPENGVSTGGTECILRYILYV
jgi:hypothetical protein